MGLGVYGNGWKMYEILLGSSSHLPFERLERKCAIPKAPNPSKGKTHDKPAFICHFCGKSGHIRPNCYKLQVAKRANKPKVLVP